MTTTIKTPTSSLPPPPQHPIYTKPTQNQTKLTLSFSAPNQNIPIYVRVCIDAEIGEFETRTQRTLNHSYNCRVPTRDQWSGERWARRRNRRGPQRVERRGSGI